MNLTDTLCTSARRRHGLKSLVGSHHFRFCHCLFRSPEQQTLTGRLYYPVEKKRISLTSANSKKFLRRKHSRSDDAVVSGNSGANVLWNCSTTRPIIIFLIIIMKYSLRQRFPYSNTIEGQEHEKWRWEGKTGLTKGPRRKRTGGWVQTPRWPGAETYGEQGKSSPSNSHVEGTEVHLAPPIFKKCPASFHCKEK